MDGRTRRREDTRQKLYEAAVALIAERGYSATTVDDIAERAGVAKGTVYYNFPSKPALFEELLRHGIGLLTARFREVVAGQPPREAVGALIRAELEYIQRYRAFTQLLLSEMWRTNREWQQTLRLLREGALGGIARGLPAGRGGGGVPARLRGPAGAAAPLGGRVAVVGGLLG